MKHCKPNSVHPNFSSRPSRDSALKYSGLFTLVIVLLITPFTMSNKQELKAVLQGNANFTKNLYNVLSADSGNVFFSPISAHTVLSLVYQGAKGPTKDAFASTLSIPNPEVAAEGYNAVMSQLNNTKDVQLHIANKVYLKTGFSLQSSFKDIVVKKFLSEIEQVNFTESVKAAGTINGWVETKTNKKIKDLISPDSLDADTRAVLVNAIYFKGDWLDKFDPSRTQTEKFYLNDNDTVDCQMMFRKGKYMYKDDQALDAKVLELPYKNQDLSLIVILPNKRNGIADLEAKLTNTDLTKITEGMYKPDVNVKLPKFKIETTLDLKASLIKLGLGIIFGRNADFSGMIDSEEPLYVSEVIQKAFIEVNEEGAEAAAATAIQMDLFGAVSFPTPIIEKFRADHPFIIQLQARQRDDSASTGFQGFIGLPKRQSNILFNGRVSIPEYNKY